MKRLLALVGLAAALVLTGCGKSEEQLQREHEIKLAKIQSGQDLAEKEMAHEQKLAYYSQPRPVAPIAAGNYVDYRGNLQYGYWDTFGNWRWHNEDSVQAAQTRSYLDYQVATGVIAASALAVALSRDDWDRKHRGGWKKDVIVVEHATGRDGRTLSQSEYESRAKAAKAERDMWKAKKKQYEAEAKLAKAQGKTGLTTDKKGKTITQSEADRRAAQSAKDKAAHAKKVSEQKELQRRKEQSARDKAAHAKKVAEQKAQKEKEAKAQQSKGLTLSRDNARRTAYGNAPKDKSYSGQKQSSKHTSYNNQNKQKANNNRSSGYNSNKSSYGSSSRSSSYGSSSKTKSSYGSSSRSSSYGSSSKTKSSSSSRTKKY
tara:strand:+ start:124235 stop:125353 length:1119 start_codon:yes stop_codon:yes gene_type:complete